VLGFEMADDRLDGGPAAQFALDLGRHSSLLAGDEDLELMIGRRIVAAVSLVGEDIPSIPEKTPIPSVTWDGQGGESWKRPMK
jgi:hypothetical protein